MSGELDLLEKAKRENSRWRILKILDAGRPMHVGESLIGLTLNDAGFPLTPNELRKELDYLENRQLVKIENRGSGSMREWSIELTRTGIDLVEYTIDCEPGIARPAKW